MRNKRPTQCDRIIEIMKHEWVSPLVAAQELACQRFGARIFEIKRRYEYNPEWKIEERPAKSRNRWGEDVHYKEFRLTRKEQP